MCQMSPRPIDNLLYLLLYLVYRVLKIPIELMELRPSRGVFEEDGLIKTVHVTVHVTVHIIRLLKPPEPIPPSILPVVANGLGVGLKLTSQAARPCANSVTLSGTDTSVRQVFESNDHAAEKRPL